MTLSNRRPQRRAEPLRRGHGRRSRARAGVLAAVGLRSDFCGVGKTLPPYRNGVIPCWPTPSSLDSRVVLSAADGRVYLWHEDGREEVLSAD